MTADCLFPLYFWRSQATFRLLLIILFFDVPLPDVYAQMNPGRKEMNGNGSSSAVGVGAAACSMQSSQSRSIMAILLQDYDKATKPGGGMIDVQAEVNNIFFSFNYFNFIFWLFQNNIFD